MSAENGLKKHLYRRSPVPRNEYVSLEELARELDTDVDRLKPLIDAGYLRVLDPRENLAETVVGRPLPSAMAWLRTMFMPLELRPLLSAKQICDALEITEDDFRYLCLSDNIPLYSDPAFGYLISTSGFYSLTQGWLKMQNPLRTDRQALMLLLAMLKGKMPKGRLTPMPYYHRLDKEIQRIAHLPEPERTLRATDFWQAYNDADKVTDCLKDIAPPIAPVVQKRLKRSVEAMGERMQNQGGGKKFTNAQTDVPDPQSG